MAMQTNQRQPNKQQTTKKQPTTNQPTTRTNNRWKSTKTAPIIGWAFCVFGRFRLFLATWRQI